MVVDIPYVLPLKPSQISELSDPKSTMEAIRPVLHAYHDRNLVGIFDHLLGNVSNDCNSARMQLADYGDDDNAAGFLKDIYAKNLIRFGAAYEIAKSLFIEQKPGFSFREVMNFARYDVFARNKGINMQMFVNGVEIDKFEGDFEMETSLLLNVFELIHNSAKSGAREISVNVNISDGDAEFIVDDNGCGIPMDHILNVFEKGYSTRPAEERKSGRGGLGLYYLGQYVTERNGSLVVHSFETGGDKGVICDFCGGKAEVARRELGFRSVNTRFRLSIPDAVKAIH